MSTVMGPMYELTQADIAVNYYLILGVGTRWSNDDIEKHIDAFDKAYGDFVPTRHAERSFWYMRRRAREVLLTPLRKTYDDQRRLWYLGGHGTQPDLIMLRFERCPYVFFSEVEVDLWSCIHAFIFHCTPLPKLRVGPHYMILAHFLWASRTLLLKYRRNHAEDELSDSIQGAYNVDNRYIHALGQLCRNDPLWDHREWRHLLDILTAHEMAAAFRNGERRAWLFFTVKFLEAIHAQSDARDAMIQELEMATNLRTDEGFLHLSAELVAIGRKFAHQIPWGPDYKDACATIGREPKKNFKLPWYEGDDLSCAFTAWYARMRDRLKAGKSFQEWEAEDLAALWQEYLGEANKSFACSTPEFPPRPLFLRDRRVIRAETEAALADHFASARRKSTAPHTTPDVTPDVTPHATPHLSATEGAPFPAEKFDLDSRRMSPDEQLVLALNDEKAYFAEKERGKVRAAKAAEPETPRSASPGGEDFLDVKKVSARLKIALTRTVDVSRTWQPAVEKQVTVWRAEHGYEPSVPRIPSAAYKALKDDVVRKNAEELIYELRRAYKINAGFGREGNSDSDETAGGGSKEDDDDDDVVVTIRDVDDAESATETLSADNAKPGDFVQYDEVVTILSEEEYQALAIGDISDTYKPPASFAYDAPVDTAGNPTQIDIDEDPFAFHGGAASVPYPAEDDMDMPPTPHPSHLPPPPAIKPVLVPRRPRPVVEMPSIPEDHELEISTRERENKDLEAAYDALARHATLLGALSSSDSGSDSDSDDGWGEAELFFTSPCSLDTNGTNNDTLEPVNRGGATSRAGHHGDEKFAKTSEIDDGASDKYVDYPLSDGEDEGYEEHKGKILKPLPNVKRAGKKAKCKQSTPVCIEGKPDPVGHHDWKASATSDGSKPPPSANTGGASTVGIASSPSMKTGLGPNLLGSDGITIPIMDLTGANGKDGLETTHS